ncbi:hypothetical protein GW7_15985 [Heterocephalus glaber]|uniref:Uncharacterized protein n=1 Tax=Heterocephalus glaber TaxID=10181 RepID=G5B3W7_HETGA|nr:hypothetical protein GW7_15985 [Heterocephalus glaber]
MYTSVLKLSRSSVFPGAPSTAGRWNAPVKRADEQHPTASEYKAQFLGGACSRRLVSVAGEQTREASRARHRHRHQPEPLADVLGGRAGPYPTGASGRLQGGPGPSARKLPQRHCHLLLPCRCKPHATESRDPRGPGHFGSLPATARNTKRSPREAAKHGLAGPAATANARLQKANGHPASPSAPAPPRRRYPIMFLRAATDAWDWPQAGPARDQHSRAARRDLSVT